LSKKYLPIQVTFWREWESLWTISFWDFGWLKSTQAMFYLWPLTFPTCPRCVSYSCIPLVCHLAKNRLFMIHRESFKTVKIKAKCLEKFPVSARFHAKQSTKPKNHEFHMFRINIVCGRNENSAILSLKYSQNKANLN